MKGNTFQYILIQKKLSIHKKKLTNNTQVRISIITRTSSSNTQKKYNSSMNPCNKNCTRMRKMKLRSLVHFKGDNKDKG